MRLTGGAGPEVGEDLVDHRRLGDAGDEAHRAVAGRTCQRVHLNDLLEERRRRAFTHRWLASVLVEEFEAHEAAEHGPAEHLGQAHRVACVPRHKGPVGPEPSVGDAEMPVRMPIRARAMRLHTCLLYTSPSPRD